jgi:anthranilate phosphoribosyltransferase
VRTVFNFLGPLTNPAGATRQVIGVSHRLALEEIGRALRALGTEKALVVSSADGLDEFSVAGPTSVVELNDQGLDAYDVRPQDFGIEPVADAAVGAGTPEENAAVLRSVLRGEAGTARSLAVMNAGAAIYVGGRADSLGDGARRAEESIDTGAAAEVLDRFVERSRA